MVHRMDLSYDVIVDMLHVNYITGSTNGYKLPRSIYEINDNILLLKF